MEEATKVLIHTRNIFFIFPLLMIICRANVFNVNCHKGTNYTQSKTPFQTNLDSIFSLLSSASSTAHFQSTTAGSGPDKSYAAFMCRYDLPLATCHDCVTNATSDLQAFCPGYWEASSVYRYCSVQYANQSIFSQINYTLDYGLGCDNPDFRDPLLKNTVQKTISDLIVNVTSATTRARFNGSNYYFATGEENYMIYQKVHGLVQCAPEFTTSSCWSCLRDAMSNVLEFCNATLGAAAFGVGCSVTYSLYSFYSTGGTAITTTGLIAPSQLPTANSSPAFGSGMWIGAQFVLVYLLLEALHMKKM